MTPDLTLTLIILVPMTALLVVIGVLGVRGQDKAMAREAAEVDVDHDCMREECY